MKIHTNVDGFTVREFKDIVNSWSDYDPYSGEECEVWVTTGEGLSSPVKKVVPLNLRIHGTIRSADLLIED